MPVIKIYLLLLGTLVAWEVVVQVLRRLHRPVDPQSNPKPEPVRRREHFSPEQERRRRLDLGARRWPAPARFG